MTAELACRSCHRSGAVGDVVLDLGDQPRSSTLPRRGEATPTAWLAMWLCPHCGLAQLAHDDGPEPVRASVVPAALREHRRTAIDWLAAAGHLDAGVSCIEFASPHGGAWQDDLLARGIQPGTGTADLVVDSLGLMHESDQDAALGRRVQVLAPGGRLVLMVHTLAAIVEHRQWNDLRHGHYAYWSLTALAGLLTRHGLAAIDGVNHDLYGGTVTLVARRSPPTPTGRSSLTPTRRSPLTPTRRSPLTPTRRSPLTPTRRWQQLARADRRGQWTTRRALAPLAAAVGDSTDALRARLVEARDRGLRVVGYPAASRAVSLLRIAGIGTDLLGVVGDADPDKWDRELPGGIPVSDPQTAFAGADRVLLLLPELRTELLDRHRELRGRLWVVGQS